jgi:hypothetical protein
LRSGPGSRNVTYPHQIPGQHSGTQIVGEEEWKMAPLELLIILGSLLCVGCVVAGSLAAFFFFLRKPPKP